MPTHKNPLTEEQQRLAAANRGLAYNLAIRWGRQHNLCSADVDDLVGAALLGLVCAARCYDGTRAAFSTYAVATIWRHLRACRQNIRLIRLPNYLWELMRTGDGTDPRTGRKPPHCAARGGAGLGNEEMGDTGEHYEVLAPEDTDSLAELEEAEEHAAELARLRQALARLEPNERKILHWRFGLSGERLTLKQAGHRLGRTRERARQIERQALEKLRALLSPV